MASASRKPEVYNPDETDYAVRPKEANHRSRVEILGIEESLLVPQADRRSARRPRALKELRKWRPTQMRFTHSWPDEELPDGWFELLSLDLLLRVKSFVQKCFEFDDIMATRGGSPWLGGFSSEFISYASMVARQDKHNGGWDALLRSKATRGPLVMGVIAKALEVNVFDKPLFGADPVQDDLLSTQDQATIETEGNCIQPQLDTVYRADLNRQAIDVPTSVPVRSAPASEMIPSRQTTGRPSTR